MKVAHFAFPELLPVLAVVMFSVAIQDRDEQGLLRGSGLEILVPTKLQIVVTAVNSHGGETTYKSLHFLSL